MAVYFGTNKVLGNGVAGTSLVLGHADTHSANGTDPITPESIGAAPTQHTHTYAAVPTVQTVTIPVSGWTSYSFGCTQTVSVTGMRGTSLVIVTAHPDSYDPYMAARVRCTVQGWEALTFSSRRIPSEDLMVNVMILG